jgi:hypothetical protein
MAIDWATFVYIVKAIVSIYGFGMFVWWWRRIGRASEIYIYMTIIFLGIAIASGFIIYARVVYGFESESYIYFVKSVWWSIGPLIILIALLAIDIRMTRRIYLAWQYRTGRKPDRRKNSRCAYCGKPYVGCKYCAATKREEPCVGEKSCVPETQIQGKEVK